jgi:hypothetical protein
MEQASQIKILEDEAAPPDLKQAKLIHHKPPKGLSNFALNRLLPQRVLDSLPGGKGLSLDSMTLTIQREGGDPTSP